MNHLPTTVRSFGWIFGLEGDHQEMAIGNLRIRPMDEPERRLILNAADSAFARNWSLWTNCVLRFPFVFEKVVPAGNPIGGYEPMETVFAALGPGEIRTPIQWMLMERGSASAQSGFEAMECMLRLVNNRFQPMQFDRIAGQMREAISRLMNILCSAPNFSVLDVPIIERFFAVKRNVLLDQPARFISRAADICMCLEYLFQGKKTSGDSVRLGNSVAAVLEDAPQRRNDIKDSILAAYKLRNMHVHGARWNDTTIRTASKQSVEKADLSLRRAVLAKLASGMDDSAWIQAVRDCVAGRSPALPDRITWLTV